MIANQLKNMIIGLFVIIACFLIVGIILFVKPSVGDGKEILHVRFGNINGINIGTRVTYAGKPIGEVDDIRQVVDAREKATGNFGQVYTYLLTLKVDSSYTIYTTDKIMVQTAGLLGEKYVAIVPQAFKPGQVANVVTSKDVLIGDSTDILESAMNQVKTLTDKAEETLDRMIVWIDKYGDSVGSLVHSVDVAMKEVGKTIQTLNELHFADDVHAATKHIGDTFAQIDQVLYQMRQDSFFANLTKISKNFDAITTTIAQGKGTLGRIIEEDGLYLQINSLMTKANSLINDVNQYGLLFQYSKQWQRKHRYLMSETDYIRDPKAFQAYVDQQVSEINATVSQMNELTERFNINDLANNKEFRKNFTELMKQLNGLQERVKLYNQEIAEIQYKDPCS